MNMNMTMISAFQQAIKENNEGTRLVRQCQYDAAVNSFTSVLQILKPLAAIVEDKQNKHAKPNNAYLKSSHSQHEVEDENNVNANATDADAATDADTSSTAPFAISFNNKSMETGTGTDNNTDTDTNDDDSNSDNHPASLSRARPSSSSSLDPSITKSTSSRKLKHFVFRDPVVILPESMPSLTENESASIYSSPALFSRFLMIVMYNLALTLHLQAISLIASSLSSSSNTKTKRSDRKKIKNLFVRSRTLYELAFEMHLEHTAADVEETTLFSLALTNNLGLVYRTMNERNKCTICFKSMFSTMMYLLDSSSRDHHESIVSPSRICKDRRVWDGLVANAMDILFQHTYEVAAAAA